MCVYICMNDDETEEGRGHMGNCPHSNGSVIRIRLKGEDPRKAEQNQKINLRATDTHKDAGIGIDRDADKT